MWAPAATAPAAPATEEAKPEAKTEARIAAEKKAEEADLDRSLLGEFAGMVEVERKKTGRVALQVRPVGGGAFEALQFEGGLPGERNLGGQPVALVGKRNGDFLVLSGGPWAVFVEPEHCLVLDRDGRRVGRLKRLVRQSPTLGAPPPKEATVLFDGHGTDQFTTALVAPEGLLVQGAEIRPMFTDFNLHLEFTLPLVPEGRDQGRGNSGVYLQSRYEVQILDSFAEPPVSNAGGSLYRYRPPDVNLSFPPLVWQTYDIAFTSPRWGADGKKLTNARITVWHNGVKIHDDVELENKTGAGQEESPTLLPIRLQDHGNPVRFRNIWVVDRGLLPAGKFPVRATKPATDEAK